MIAMPRRRRRIEENKGAENFSNVCEKEQNMITCDHSISAILTAVSDILFHIIMCIRNKTLRCLILYSKIEMYIQILRRFNVSIRFDFMFWIPFWIPFE